MILGASSMQVSLAGAAASSKLILQDPAKSDKLITDNSRIGDIDHDNSADHHQQQHHHDVRKLGNLGHGKQLALAAARKLYHVYNLKEAVIFMMKSYVTSGSLQLCLQGQVAAVPLFISAVFPSMIAGCTCITSMTTLSTVASSSSSISVHL
ncbi:unnamed protein product [Sphagnum troendelagicum]|uniref:Uncharacterized protein n=1 Tax=Sphagnum troendelagicum TaxID=128251 RepID=A0ABP0T8K7_9BRYO